ncbi:MAG: phosphoglycerate kinase [bacterium]
MNKLFVDQVNVKNKRVLVRTDFNVPLDSMGEISDDTRIRSVLPTINYLLDEGAKVILMSHMGRPKGKRDSKLSLSIVARRLQRLLQKDVLFVNDCIGNEVKAAVQRMRSGDVILLENLRFYIEEEKNDENFSRQLAEHGEVFVNDAFATAHRAHASNVGVTKFISPCVGGFLMKKEITYFQSAMETPIRPLAAIFGGAKVSGKIEALKNLIDKVDKIVIGGGMAFTFLKANGFEVGKSMVEENMIEVALDIMKSAKKQGVKLYLPVDVVIAEEVDPRAVTKVVPIQDIPANWMGLDIGPATTSLFAEALENAKTIVWNGPMGVFEIDAFSRGTFAMVNTVANSYAMTIVGGGDTDVAVHRVGESYKISYISTGGGAFLELLEGKELPGIAALTSKED